MLVLIWTFERYRSLEMQFENFQDAARASQALRTIREDLKVQQLGPDDSGQLLYNDKNRLYRTELTIKCSPFNFALLLLLKFTNLCHLFASTDDSVRVLKTLHPGAFFFTSL